MALSTYTGRSPALHDVTVKPDTTATATSSSTSAGRGVHADASIEDHEFSSDEQHSSPASASSLPVGARAASRADRTRCADVVILRTSTARVRSVASVAIVTVSGETTATTDSTVTGSTAATLATVVALRPCTGARLRGVPVVVAWTKKNKQTGNVKNITI